MWGFRKTGSRRRRCELESRVRVAEVLEDRLLLTCVGEHPAAEIGLDIDNNHMADPLSDGVLLIRWLAGFTDDALVKDVVDPAGQRLAPDDIDAYLNGRLDDLDIDRNGSADPLSDGIVALRHTAGFTGDALTFGAIDAGGNRTNPGLVSGHLDWLSTAVSVSPSFNDDFLADIVGLRDDQLWLAASDGSAFGTTVWGDWDSDIDWLNVDTGDFDGDGHQDFVGRDKAGNWQVGRSDGAEFSNEQWGNWSPQTFWEDVNIADVNGDGRSDIVGHVGGAWSVALSMGTGFNTEPWGNWPVGGLWDDVTAGDVNGDGRDDLLGQMQDGTWWSAIAGDSQFDVQPWASWPTDTDYNDVLTGDFNGDCRIDVLGRADGSLQVGLSTETGTGSAPVEWGRGPAGTIWQDVKVLDVNGDGRDDVAGRVAGQWWTGISTGADFVVEKWGEPWNAPNESANWQDVTVADVDGDGRDDLVGRRQGQWTAAVSRGSDFNVTEFGNWDRDNWSLVRSSRPGESDDVSRLPATGFAAGAVTTEINTALLALIDELRQELNELDTQAEELLDLGPTLDDLDAIAQQITEHQQSIQPVIDGTVNEVQIGPETVVTRTTLAESDRLVWGTMLDLTGQSSADGGLDSIDDVHRLGEAFYTKLVTDTITGSRDTVARFSDILSSVSGHWSAVVQGVTAMTLAGISAALESGIVMIKDGNATVDDYAQTTDILLEHVANAELLRQQVANEIDAALDAWFLEALQLVAQVGNQFNPSRPGSTGQQIQNAFQGLQDRVGSSNATSRSILGTWSGFYGARNSPITVVITQEWSRVDLGDSGTIRGAGLSNQQTRPDGTILSTTFTGRFSYHGCNCSSDLNPSNTESLSVELNANGELAGSFSSSAVRLMRQ